MKNKKVVITIIILSLIICGLGTNYLYEKKFKRYIEQFKKIQGLTIESEQLKTKNYVLTKKYNSVEIKFSELDGTDFYKYNIKEFNNMKINSKVESGSVKLKITQGDIWSTDVDEFELSNKENSINVPLDKWKNNEQEDLSIWLIGSNANNGEINIIME